MARQTYYFPFVAKGKPRYHVAITAKTMMERSGEITDIFTRYNSNALPTCPGQILYLMSKANESIFELGETESTTESDSTSPKVKSSPESSSTAKEAQSVSGVKRKRLSFGDAAKPGELKAESFPGQAKKVSPRKKPSSTVTKASDIIPTEELSSKEETAMIISSPSTSGIKISSQLKSTQKDADSITPVKESPGPSKKAKDPDSGSPGQEFKIPAIPDKDEQEVFKRAKRPKLVDSTTDFPTFSPRKRAKTSSDSAGNEEMDISPKKDDELSCSPSKYSQSFATSPAGFESPPKIEKLFSSMATVDDDKFEFDMSTDPEEDISAMLAASEAEVKELNDRVNDPATIEAVKKLVNDHLKVTISPIKTKRKVKSPKKPSTPSPRKSRKLNSPVEVIEEAEIKPRVQLSHPNVLAYIKMRFRSVLKNRDWYMYQIYAFFDTLDSDVKFLHFFSTCIKVVVNDLNIENEVFFTQRLSRLKERILTNATARCNTLRPLVDSVRMDVSFFARCITEARILNRRNEHLLSEESGSLTTIESLKRYESRLRNLWDMMDSRVILGERIASTIVEISANYIRLTNDFNRYLVRTELMKPCSDPNSEAEINRLRISYY